MQKKKQRRKSISRGKRDEVFRKYEYRCAQCGASASKDVRLEIDHIIPHSTGGTNDLLNLQLLCQPCNLGKSDKIPGENRVLELRLKHFEDKKIRLEEYRLLAEEVHALAKEDESGVQLLSNYWHSLTGWPLPDGTIQKLKAFLIKNEKAQLKIDGCFAAVRLVEVICIQPFDKQFGFPEREKMDGLARAGKRLSDATASMLPKVVVDFHRFQLEPEKLIEYWAEHCTKELMKRTDSEAKQYIAHIKQVWPTELDVNSYIMLLFVSRFWRREEEYGKRELMEEVERVAFAHEVGNVFGRDTAKGIIMTLNLLGMSATHLKTQLTEHMTGESHQLAYEHLCDLIRKDIGDTLSKKVEYPFEHFTLSNQNGLVLEPFSFNKINFCRLPVFGYPNTPEGITVLVLPAPLSTDTKTYGTVFNAVLEAMHVDDLGLDFLGMWTPDFQLCIETSIKRSLANALYEMMLDQGTNPPPEIRSFIVSGFCVTEIMQLFVPTDKLGGASVLERVMLAVLSQKTWHYQICSSQTEDTWLNIMNALGNMVFSKMNLDSEDAEWWRMADALVTGLIYYENGKVWNMTEQIFESLPLEEGWSVIWREYLSWRQKTRVEIKKRSNIIKL